MKVQVKKYDPSERPNLSTECTITLKDGPRVRRIAKHLVVLDQHTGLYHHDTITIKSYKRTKDVSTLIQERSIALDGDETKTIIDYISSIRESTIPLKTGAYHLMPSYKPAETEALVRLLDAGNSASVDALAVVLQQAVQRPELLRSVLERVAEQGDVFLAQAATVINLFVYKKAVSDLERLIGDDNAKEVDFQRLLAENPWLFGSEYTQLLSNRHLTRDEQQDFLFVRTTDGYIEVVEIKTPLGSDPLFAYDRSHDTYYAKADLSKVLAQVENYLEKIDRRRDSILSDDGLDANKVRAKIFIGRDGDENQVRALRRLNGDRHRVEVVTFDGLLRIARRVLSYLETAVGPAEVETGQGERASDKDRHGEAGHTTASVHHGDS